MRSKLPAALAAALSLTITADAARRRTGNRWSEQMRSASGFLARHPEGM